MLSVLRRVGAHPRLEPYVAAGLRSRAVRPSLPFFAGEARSRGARDYVVRANGAPIHIEHGTTDAGTMDQAFVQQVYEPSAAAEAAVRALGRPPVVLDAGANIGMFSIWASRRWPGCRAIAVEPLPRNIALLERNLALALPAGTYEVVPAAATTADGEVTFGGGAFTNGRVLDGGEPASDSVTVPARDLFALTDGVDVLKLDIEGGEWPILADPRFSAALAPVIMLEHHPMNAPAGATPEVSAETLLERAGYVAERTVTEFAGAGILWGVRR
ncbi:MAG TPA: FkbM family methyltransferase [Baekduia sp.]|jgi:FkbM family methyltransferase